jgi:uncharacterized protein (DUF433 family)
LLGAERTDAHGASEEMRGYEEGGAHMHLASATMPHPLREDADGVIRVGPTRVTLQTVIEAYDQGATPEEIALRYPVLTLEQVYGTISYYLTNERALRGYLNEQRANSEAARQDAEQWPVVSRLRERLRERR